MSVTKKGSNADHNDYFMNDYEPLNTTIRDPYGQRSRAWRHKSDKSSDTDKLFSATELTEARTTYLPERNMFRPLDNVVCFMISTFGEKQDSRMANLLGVICLPLVMAYLGYMVLMARWDRWRAGPPPETE